MRMLRDHKGHIGYNTVEKIAGLVCPGNVPEEIIIRATLGQEICRVLAPCYKR